MRVPSPNAYLVNGTSVAESSGLQFQRRDFLKTIGVASVAGAALALTPKLSSAEPALADQVWRRSCQDWRVCVMEFISAIYLDRGHASEINSQLKDAELFPNEVLREGSFHDQFGAHQIFTIEIEYDRARCENGFLLKKLPYYGVTCGCAEIKDLNSYEIGRITSAEAINYFKCVVSPNGLRRRLGPSDHAHYKETIRESPYDESEWEPNYVRPFLVKKTGRVVPAYGIKSKTLKDAFDNPNAALLIGSTNV